MVYTIDRETALAPLALLLWAISRVITDNLNLSNDCPYANVADVGLGVNRCKSDKNRQFSTTTFATTAIFPYLAIAEFAAFAALLPQTQCTICKIGK
jgi:hypothetical protein